MIFLISVKFEARKTYLNNFFFRLESQNSLQASRKLYFEELSNSEEVLVQPTTQNSFDS